VPFTFLQSHSLGKAAMSICSHGSLPSFNNGVISLGESRLHGLLSLIKAFVGLLVEFVTFFVPFVHVLTGVTHAQADSIARLFIPLMI